MAGGLQLCVVILDDACQREWKDRPLYEKIWDAITFKDAPERLDGLVKAIADHFGAPKDWRTNRNGELASVEPGFVSVTGSVN